MTRRNLRFIWSLTMTKKEKKAPKATPVAENSTQADRIIALLGGVRPASRVTGIPATTISGWRKFGFIPAHRQEAILKAAQLAGIKLTPKHFFA